MQAPRIDLTRRYPQRLWVAASAVPIAGDDAGMKPKPPWHLTHPEQTLEEILRRSRAVIGDVVIARVDIDTQDVTGVRRLAGAVGPPDCASAPDLPRYLELSGRCREIARALGSDRAFVGSGWAIPTAVLVTLVCRQGRVVVTAREVEWLKAWRYANHVTDAFDGAVYAVTPHGWMAVGDPGFGVQPRLGDVPQPRLCVVS